MEQLKGTDMKNKLTYEQQTELVGYYDTCANYFGGDPVIEVENKYFSKDKLGYLDWLKRTSKRISRAGCFGDTYKIVGKSLTRYCNI